MTHSLLRRLSPCLLVLALGSFVFTAAEAQVIDNSGTDFLTAVLPNTASGNPTIEVHLTAAAATDVTVHYPALSPTFSSTVAVGPGAITVVTVPLASSTAWSANTIQNNAIRAFAPTKFVMYTVNRAPFTSDAALALPVEALNTDYIVTTYRSSEPQIAVVAAFDNTQLTITPSAAMTGRPAGVPFAITLQRGEGYFNRGTINTDLTGTLISASRPVAMVNGNLCATVLPGTGFCDHIYQVAQPLASWGNSGVAAPLPNRPNGSVYRVVAAENTTVVQRNGVVVATLDRGQVHETAIVSGPQVFSADKPIFVTQFMTGSSSTGAILGDPAMGNVTPSEQFLSAYTFSTVGGDQFTNHFLGIIAENADVAGGSILLDGTAIPDASFSAIPGTTLSYATIPLSEGTHHTSSIGTHGIMVSGIRG